MERSEQRVDAQSEIARLLIQAMKEQKTPWQRPWNAEAMRPMNPTSGNAYRGINRLLLSLGGRSDSRFMTYQQAAQQGWQVRKGEKGTQIIKLVEVGAKKAGEAEADVRGDNNAQRVSSKLDGKSFVLRRYTVFNAEQIDGLPPAARALPLDDLAIHIKAENVLTALKATGLSISHQGHQACYIPSGDQILLPPRESFHSAYDYYATALHEAAHSTLNPGRLNRVEAIAKRWGDEAYSMEELRAEICSAILAAETGVRMSPDHIQNHAAYLSSWIANLERDPMAIFTAAKDAEQMAEYLLGLEAKLAASSTNKEWDKDFDREMERQASLSR